MRENILTKFEVSTTFRSGQTDGRSDGRKEFCPIYMQWRRSWEIGGPDPLKYVGGQSIFELTQTRTGGVLGAVPSAAV